VLYNATTRALFDQYDEFNAVVEELEARGQEDLLRQGFVADDLRYRLELDMRYGNQLVTTAVVLDISRMNGVADVLHTIRTFSDVYSHRYGSGSAAPEAGIRVQTIRVAAYVEGDVVRFESLQAGGERTQPTPNHHRPVHFIDEARPLDTPVYDQTVLTPEHVIAGPAIVTTENTTFLVEPGWRLEPTSQGAVWFLQD
jgi:N-methylhydantoinase A